MQQLIIQYQYHQFIKLHQYQINQNQSIYFNINQFISFNSQNIVYYTKAILTIKELSKFVVFPEGNNGEIYQSYIEILFAKKL